MKGKRKLPEGWSWVEIRKETENSISIFNKGDYFGGEFCYIDISSVDNITKNILGFSVIPVNDAPSRAKYVLKQNDIIISTVRPNLNSVTLIKETHDGHICSSGFCVIRVKRNHHARYFFYYLISPYFVEAVSRLVQGAMYPAISDSDVMNFRIPLPPTCDDEVAIANELEREMAETEKIRQAALRQKEAVTAMQGAILREAFPFEVGDRLPGGWIWEKLNRISNNIQYGISRESSPSKVGPQLLRITDIQNGRVDWATVPFCECDNNEEQQYSLKDGDIVFVRTGATTGKSFLLENPERSLFASYLIRVQCNKDLVLPNYLYNFFQTPLYWSYIYRGARGGTLAGFNASMLSDMNIPLPPTKDEQTAITNKLEQKMAEIEKMRRAADRQLEAVEALPGAILREVFDFDEDIT